MHIAYVIDDFSRDPHREVRRRYQLCVGYSVGFEVGDCRRFRSRDAGCVDIRPSLSSSEGLLNGLGLHTADE